MLYIIDKVTDPYWNLAAEEYLLKNFDRPVFRLWRNEKAVIVGRYQNSHAEINRKFIDENNVPVVRRISGGGAVFHDMGNILFTFADKRIQGEDTGEMFRRFTSPVIAALKSLGVNAYLEGRNDLLIDGLKFSGNAVAYHGDRVLQHGTLLFSSSMGDLAGALNTRPEKFVGKAVQSNRARVTNISDHLPSPMSIDDFMNYLYSYISSCCGDGDDTMYDFTQEQVAEINTLRNSKYITDEWNYGKSPKCSVSNVQKFPSGLYEFFADIEDGRLNNVSIRGDYFFSEDTSFVERALTGVPFDRESVLSALVSLSGKGGNPLSDYFNGIEVAEFMELIFDYSGSTSA